MPIRSLIAVALLVALQQGVQGQSSLTADVGPMPVSPDSGPKSAPADMKLSVQNQKGMASGLDLAIFDPCDPVTWGSPEVAPGLWQRTWGVAGITGYPVGSKIAPNGVPYDPLFSINLLLNVALSKNREVYLFVETRFWGQKAAQGITNGDQGQFDFSKRQFDFDIGLAWNYTGRFEARAYAYSSNNLNRGTTLDRPFGYNDGFALENRYYLPTTDFDKGLYRFVGVGYFVTKELIGADGRTFKPSAYLDSSLALDLIPDFVYAFADLTLITQRPLTAKLLLADVGLAFRPFPTIPDLEFRIGADNNVDLDVGFTRTLFYGNVRIVW